jgi:hypothetical protein
MPFSCLAPGSHVNGAATPTKPERGARKSPEEIEVVHKPGFVGGAAIGAIEVILFAGLALVGVLWRSIA